ncbi:MAG TPA: hypothetical protein VNZ67_14585 [bacterium]|jgi:hypothetical protein|nr:hypothetical protein [bacterium]
MELFQNPWFEIVVLAAASVLLHAYGFLGSTYSAKQWALRDESHRIFKGAAYLGVLPLRIVFSLFSAVVATLIWAVVIGGFYLVARCIRGL